MSIRMTDDEAWAFLSAGHTGILTTLRRDGWPVALPIWFVVHDRRIYVGTPAGSKKVRRIAHDDRASFLVESGRAWTELAAVQLAVRATVVDPEHRTDELATVGRLFAAKYADHRPKSTRLPKATSTHYSSQAIIRLDPVGDPITWDNSRIRLRDPDKRGTDAHR